MKKIALVVAILMLISTSVFAALTTAEKNYLREIYKYYSGEIPSVNQNETIQTAILEGTESERKAIIKDYLEDIVLPELQNNYAIVQAEVTKLNNLITQIQAWIAAN